MPPTATPSPHGMLQGYRDFHVGFDYATGKDIVSSFEDGLYVFNMRDPENPSTVGCFDTCHGPERRGPDPRTLAEGNTGFNGARGIDVRNADGLIVVSDFTTGVHIMKLDGFDGWNGADRGMPNVSSVRDRDNPPRRVIPWGIPDYSYTHMCMFWWRKLPKLLQYSNIDLQL